MAGAFGRWLADGNGRGCYPPSYDDCWCLCGHWVFASAVFCNCGLPTARYRKGDWMCGSCRHTNFARTGKDWCQKCNGSITAGLHAYGDDTVNRAQQQLFLTPRNVEAARPVVIDSELYKGSGEDSAEGLHKL
eukprot:2043591-Heterocapsa_arctica.AAC.1